MKKAPDLYQDITDTIVAAIEKGLANPDGAEMPWVALAGSGGTPTNATTNRAYSGVNQIILWIKADEEGFTSQRWLTFKQALELGGAVRKGEKGTKIIFVKPCSKTVRDAQTGEETEERYTTVRSYTVFNVTQCEGLPPSALGAPKRARSKCELQADLLAWRSATGADIRHGGNRAFYRSSDDFIGMPTVEQFKSENAYWATLAHELTHWTGHKSRLDRSLGNRFGSDAYAVEELIAEIGAAFVCSDLGIKSEVSHANYIANWLRVLKSDKRAIVTAAAQATKAAKFLQELTAAAVPEELAEAA